MDEQNRFNNISKKFGLGEITEFFRLEDGIVNVSYKVKTKKGRFVFQCLSRIFNEKVIEDYENVQSYLRTNGIFVPVLLKGLDNKSYAKEENKIWRVFEFIDHDPIPQITSTLSYKAGKILGKFHKTMYNFEFQPKFKLEGFHDTENILKKLNTLIKNPAYQSKTKIAETEINFINNNISNYYQTPESEKIIIHADPKLANFLFKKGRIIALLDLDTMMFSNPLIDIGDALRSWCRVKPATSIFRQDIFEAALKGYNSESVFKYTKEEAKKAMSLLTLELSCRYLNDYFEENYFSFKSEKYKTRSEQNLARCKRYLEYFNNFTQK